MSEAVLVWPQSPLSPCPQSPLSPSCLHPLPKHRRWPRAEGTWTCNFSPWLLLEQMREPSCCRAPQAGHTADKDWESNRSSHKYAAGQVRAARSRSRQGPGVGGMSRKCEVCSANCHEGPGCFLRPRSCHWAAVLLRCTLRC